MSNENIKEVDELVEFIGQELHILQEMKDCEDLIIVVGGKYALLTGMSCYGLTVKSILSQGVNIMGLMKVEDYKQVLGMPYQTWHLVFEGYYEGKEHHEPHYPQGTEPIPN